MSLAAIGVPVGRDHPLVDRRYHPNLDTGINDEQGLKPVLLLVGKEVCTSAQGPPRAVERIIFATQVPVEVLLSIVLALVSPPRRMMWKGSITVTALGIPFSGSSLEAGNPIHRDQLHLAARRLGPFSQPGLKCLFRMALDHIQQSYWDSTVVDRDDAVEVVRLID